jgi:sugar/nucleoside kinase (ribokinase family)
VANAPDRVLLLAPLCRDRIVGADASAQERAGGAGLYASWALVGRGARVALHTPLAEADRDLLQALPPEVEVTVHPTPRTTCFEIAVDPLDAATRSLRLLAASNALDPARIVAWGGAAHVLFAPLWPTDLSEPLAAWLRSCGAPLDVGVQGLVRTLEPWGGAPGPGARAGVGPAVRLAVAPVSEARLPRLRVLAGDGEEVAACSRRYRAAETITTRAERGARIAIAGAPEALEIPAAPARAALHPIGLGDTFLAVYGWERTRGAEPRDAGARAAKAARDLLERGLPRRA